MDVKFDFSWGNTFGIREWLVNNYPSLELKTLPINDFGYPPHEGNLTLIDKLKNLTKTLTGNDYRYVLITNGCTHAIHAYIHAKKGEDKDALACRKTYFAFYKGIADVNGLIFSPGTLGHSSRSIQVVDSPGNPLGETGGLFGSALWDGAYHSPTYGVRIGFTKNLNTPQPDHEAFAGSFGKFSGINGIRIGWLATNDLAIYEPAFHYVTHTACGVSSPSQWLAERFLDKVDLSAFWKGSQGIIDSNKTEIEKLLYLFGNQDLSNLGMFALFETDSKLNKLFKKAEVLFADGASVGAPGHVRINLAHTNEMTRLMVKNILKIDKR